MIFDEGCGEGVNLVKDDKAEANVIFSRFLILFIKKLKCKKSGPDHNVRKATNI